MLNNIYTCDLLKIKQYTRISQNKILWKNETKNISISKKVLFNQHWNERNICIIELMSKILLSMSVFLIIRIENIFDVINYDELYTLFREFFWSFSQWQEK